MSTQCPFFSQLIAFGLLAVSPFSSFADEIEDEQKMPVPIIKQVILDEKNNPYTRPPYNNPDQEIDPDLCKGFTLTEADVREFFRVSRRSNRIEEHEFYPSGCEVGGKLILQDGSKAGFWIDRNRQGSMSLGRNISLVFYCAKCKHPAYYKACDIKCLRDEMAESDRSVAEIRRKTKKMPVPVIKHVIFDDNPFTVPDIRSPNKKIDPDICKGFTLTEADVREFFSVSNRIKDDNDFFFRTRCEVRGTLILKNGKKASFDISRARQGYIVVDEKYYLPFYCAKCEHPAYYDVKKATKQ